MPSSSVFIYETEDSEILYLVVHVEKPPALENEKYYFNSNIIVQNTIYSIENSTTNHDTTYAFTIDMTTGGICFYETSTFFHHQRKLGKNFHRFTK